MSIKSPHQQRVEKFMTLADQVIPVKPVVPDERTRHLRAGLMLEEVLETVAGLGFTVITPTGERLPIKGWTLVADLAPDLEQIADGCADTSVVTIGTLSACGIADIPLLEAIDANNLEKFGPGSYKNKVGKLIKPPSHQPPDIAAVLHAQGYEPQESAANQLV